MRPTALLLFGVWAAGCAADAPAPRPPPAAPELPALKPIAAAPYARPLIVRWSPEQRADLETVMQSGVAVVAFDAHGLRLLGACKLAGDYAFYGTALEHRVVRLTSPAEAQVNVPPATASPKPGVGEATHDTSGAIDVTLFDVGVRASTRANASTQDLKGDCEGATHVVRGVRVGAFDARPARGAADVNGHAVTREGDPVACQGAPRDALSPPANCAAALALLLGPVTPSPLPGGLPFAATLGAESCPDGYVASEAKCAGDATRTAFQCELAGAGACEAQCARGHAGSCTMLGYMFERGQGGLTPDARRAHALYRGACESGEPRACDRLGLLYAHGALVEGDAPRAMESFRRACELGDPYGCGDAGVLLLDGKGVAKDEATGADYLTRGCNGGDPAACSHLGAAFVNATALARDDARAAALFRRGCEGGDLLGCADLGSMYAEGHAIGRDFARAYVLLKRACEGGYRWACERMRGIPRPPRAFVPPPAPPPG